MQLKLFRIAVLLLVVFVWRVPTTVFSAQPDESQLKAVFVLNFAKLTEWPADIHAEGNTFTITILGKVPSTTFINMLKGQTVHGASVTVKHIDNVRQAKDSQLLYVSESERHHLTAILKDINQQNILTISDIAGFCEAGGMIGLVPVQSRLGFEVNVAAVRKTHLSVSSQLLKLARTIFGN